MRAVIANDLALGVGKELGITKAEIKKAISEKAVNKKTQSDNVAALPDLGWKINNIEVLECDPNKLSNEDEM